MHFSASVWHSENKQLWRVEMEIDIYSVGEKSSATEWKNESKISTTHTNKGWQNTCKHKEIKIGNARRGNGRETNPIWSRYSENVNLSSSFQFGDLEHWFGCLVNSPRDGPSKPHRISSLLSRSTMDTFDVRHFPFRILFFRFLQLSLSLSLPVSWDEKTVRIFHEWLIQSISIRYF